MTSLSFVKTYVDTHYNAFMTDGISTQVIVHPDEFHKWETAIQEGKQPPANWNLFWNKVDVHVMDIPEASTLAWMLDNVTRHAWLQGILAKFCDATEEKKVPFVQRLNGASIPHVMSLHFIMDDVNRDQYLLTAKLLKNKSINTSQIFKYIPHDAACWNHLPALKGLLAHMFNVAMTVEMRDYFKLVYTNLSPELQNHVLQTMVELDEKRFYEVGQNFSSGIMSAYYYARLPLWRREGKDLIQESKHSMNYGFKSAYLTALLVYYKEHSEERPDVKEISHAIRFVLLLDKHKKNSFDGVKAKTKEWLKGHHVDLDVLQEQLTILGETLDIDKIVTLGCKSFQSEPFMMELDMSALGLGDE